MVIQRMAKTRDALHDRVTNVAYKADPNDSYLVEWYRGNSRLDKAVLSSFNQYSKAGFRFISLALQGIFCGIIFL